MILDRIIYPTHYCSKAIQFLETILYEHSSWGDNERPMSQWDQIMFVVMNSLLDFVEYCKCTTMVNNNKHPLFNEELEAKPKSSDLGQDSDEAKRWYLGTYLLNLIFDKLVLNMDMDLTTIYSHLYPWKYNIKRPFQNKSKTIEMYTPGGKTKMLDLVFRCALNPLV
ncbi:hypothetical protein BDC45DRAFT_4305 [Circinella umbellata]|nr:hypothetical protein BDC45DRAFT_4305 [Circinella umbellata]